MSLPALWTWRRILQLAGLAAIGILQAAAALVVALLGSRLLTLDGPQHHEILLPPGIALAAGLLIVSRILQRRYAEKFALGYVAELRTAFMSHVVRMPADTQQLRTGLVMTRVVNDMSAIKLWLSSGLVAIFVAAAILLSVAAMLAAFVPGMAVTLLLAFSLWCIPVALCMAPLENRIRESRRQRGRIASRAGAILAARLTLLGFGRHGPAMRRLSRLSQKMNTALVVRASLSGLMRSSGDLVFPAVVLISYAGSSMMSGGTVDAVSLGVLVMMTGLMATHLSAVALGLEYRLAHSVAMARLDSIVQKPAIDPDRGQRLKKRKGARGLSVHQLPVGADGRVISMDVGPGEMVWLPGLNEAEADDFVLKAARLKEAAGGSIVLDGYDAASARARGWWREVTVISRHLSLVRASVRDNAMLGANCPASEDERRRILAAFDLSDDGIGTMAVGEDGRAEGVAACAVRAARAVLRHSALVLIADVELTADVKLFGILMDELEAIDTTVVVAGDVPENWRGRLRRIDDGVALPNVA